MNEKYNIISADDKVLISNLIHTIDKDMSRIYNRELLKFGLTMQQSVVILFIANSDKEKIYQIDIEKYLGLKNPSVTSLIKNLVSNGYVYRVKDEADGRYFHLHLTEKSLFIKDDLAKTIYDINGYIESVLPKDEFDTLTSLLVKVVNLVKEKLNEEQ